jgi:hypothetical protein
MKEEEYDDGDARTMSPRRSSEEIEKMGQDAREALIEWVTFHLQGRPSDTTTSSPLRIISASKPVSHWNTTSDYSHRQAKTLQATLMEIVDRVEVVKNEHEKLEGGNRFLQSWVYLMHRA